MELSSNEMDRLEARDFQEWYISLLEKCRDRLYLFLAKDAIMEWFGKTIQGPVKIAKFLWVEQFKHRLQPAEPLYGDVGLRSYRLLKILPPSAAPIAPPDNSSQSDPFTTPECKKCTSDASSSTSSTSSTASSIHTKSNINNNGTIAMVGDNPLVAAASSGSGAASATSAPAHPPEAATQRVEVGQGDCSYDAAVEEVPVAKKLKAKGFVEFSRPSSKGSPASKWERPCTFKAVYTGSPSSDQGCTIYLIAYEDTSSCRRNLLEEFQRCAKK